ncbi:M20 metallopeptidase family protein [Fusibacter ferrireducens]|uniref:Amidohydrolase n=1 Tax=Fusibacter ferrireducens TaxID=2785058 RepID=A0ABR9ZQV3_9FIRM|nr:M20 family metallopeptidase [Fusibacter ferrireducens]MBF4692814.1 amidohydrolase [Fusibacter ferrireducens]
MQLDQLASDVIEFRRELHKIPENGFEEHKTSQYLQTVLKSLNIDFEIVFGTGILAYIKGRDPKRTLAFRTDMDGLPVTEESSCSVHSEHKGYMHACGHDGHMAMMLGFAKWLSENSNDVLDNILLIFQPAEEGPGGASPIVKGGYLKKYHVDEIYGIHLYPVVPEGKFGLKSGAMMAMTGELDIDIITKSAHGAQPHQGIDAIVIAAQLISALQSIVSRNVSPIKSSVLTIGRLESGERRNIISGSARLEGTLRAFDKAVYELLKKRIVEILEGYKIAYDLDYKIEIRDLYPPVINDNRLFEQFVRIQGADQCVVLEEQMISEDFAFYQEAVPGLFYFVGTYNAEKGYTFPLHNSKFNFDETVLLNGIKSYVNVLLDYNKSRK